MSGTWWENSQIQISPLPSLELKGSVRYNEYHRQKDVALVRKLWPVAEEELPIFFADTSPKIQKKYRRVMKTHMPYWVSVFEWDAPCFESAQKIVKSIEDNIPKVNGRPVFGNFKEVWEMAFHHEMDVDWTLPYVMCQRYLLATCDHAASIDINMKMLKICNRQRRKEWSVPQSDEVQTVLELVRSKINLKIYEESVLQEARCAAAAIRLLLRDEDEKLIHPLKMISLHNNVGPVTVAGNVLRLAVLCKIRTRVARPIFSIDEINAYEKELGFGMYSSQKYKCATCSVPRSKMRLTRCKCERIWYCGEPCYREDWKNHKKTCRCVQQKNKSSSPVTYVDPKLYETLRANAMEGDGFLLGIQVVEESNVEYAMLCVHPLTNELFDPWTDTTFLPRENEGMQPSSDVSVKVDSRQTTFLVNVSDGYLVVG
ncbi:MYND finger domain containing protein [Nitzschia inconspicua]|uniref:MYND finger domain containing protein n=1 Tax=Nitzschia inconspicua TaxID=303405 RepID=A0A9K3LEM7_9STRA|nr:MYND finger domain containing protein [Nitzschia inconspicua]